MSHRLRKGASNPTLSCTHTGGALSKPVAHSASLALYTEPVPANLTQTVHHGLNLTSTTQSPWVETVPELKQRSSHYKSEEAKFCFGFSIRWAFCPCGLPLFQLRRCSLWAVCHNLKRNANFRSILLHEFALILEFDAALLLQIRFESDRLSSFLFQKFDWKFKMQSALLVQAALLFWHSASSIIRIGSKIRKKTLSSWQKIVKIQW